MKTRELIIIFLLCLLCRSSFGAELFPAPRDADERLGEVCSRVWLSATDDERRAAYDYTRAVNDFNAPLNGYTSPDYNPASFVGVGRALLSERITDLTALINRSSYDFDILAVRGANPVNTAAYFNRSPEFLRKIIDTGDTSALDEYAGKTNVIPAFVSAAAARGAGYAPVSPIVIYITLPCGSRVLYTEPFTAANTFGPGLAWDGKSPRREFGTECEIIINRGGTYRLDGYETDTNLKGKTLILRMTLVGQKYLRE